MTRWRRSSASGRSLRRAGARSRWPGLPPRDPPEVAGSYGDHPRGRRPPGSAMRQTSASWRSTCSADSTCWITIVAAPMTPAWHAGAGRHDLELAGGQGEGAAVDDLAHAGEQALAGLGEDAADDDDRGVEHAHAGRQHLADGRARPDAPRGRRADVAAADQVEMPLPDRRRCPISLSALDRRPAGDRLEAADVAAVHSASPPCGAATWPRSPAAPWRRGAGVRR